MGSRTEERRDLLARQELFSELDDRALDDLIQVCRLEPVKARAELYHKGDEAHQIFLILSGRLKVAASSPDGEDVVFSIMEPGELVGEVALFAETPRTGTVIALEASELIVFHRRDFMPFLERHPKTAIKMAQVLARRLFRLSERVEDSRFLNLPGRLSKLLLSLADRFAIEGKGGIKIDLKLSQSDLAEMAGATREAVNKQMRAGKQAGLVDHGQGVVTILNRDGLEDETDL